MAAVRTQIYLTQAQRQRLDALRRRRDVSLAEVIRDAVDEFLEREGLGPEETLAVTFGAVADLTVPDRGEWASRANR